MLFVCFLNFLNRTVMGTTSSGNAIQLLLAARYKVRASMISLTTLSLASYVQTCFLASLSDTRVSGMALSCRGLGFDWKKLWLEESRGYKMYYAAGTN